MSDIRGITWATVYQWEIQIERPSGMQAFGTVTPEQLNLICESVDLPTSSNQSFEVNIRGHKVKNAGIQTYAGTFSATLVETTSSPVSRLIREWKDLTWRANVGSQVVADEYKSNIIVKRFSTNDALLWVYYVIGCYVEDSNLGTLDGATSDAMKPQITFSYDYYTEGESLAEAMGQATQTQ